MFWFDFSFTDGFQSMCLEDDVHQSLEQWSRWLEIFRRRCFDGSLNENIADFPVE